MIKIPGYVHALLSPSKAHLWLTCLGGLAAAKHITERSTNRYAAEGTVYHDVSRRALTDGLDCIAYVGDRYEVEGFEFVVDEANAEEAQKYVDIIRAIPGRRFVEVDLEYSTLLGLPKFTPYTDAEGKEHQQPVAAGSGDAVILDYENKVIHVVDLKFGRGDIVYAKENPQLRLYGAAAVARYDLLGITDEWLCKMYIVQPRAGHYDDEAINVGELKAWTEKQKRPANRAYTLYTSPHLASPSDLTPGDKQCRWCPLSGNCVAQRDRVLGMFPKTRAAEVTQLLTSLDDVQLTELLDSADEIERALSAARAEALSRALRGVVLPNWKLVQGRRGNRKLDEKAHMALDVPTMLEIGIEEPDPEGGGMPVEDAIHFALKDKAYKPRELLTAAQLEKKLTKAAPLLWAALQPYITQSEGAPGLERMEDPRPPLVIVSPEFPTTPEAGALPSLV